MFLSVSTPPRWTWLPLPHGRVAEPIARAWLAGQLGCAPMKLVIERDSYGRPWLGGAHRGWDCNWSHSGDGLLVALGQGLRLGADLEWPRPRPRALELARRFFTASEADWLQGLSDEARQAGFVRLWCAKEAVLKAHGRGIAFGLARLAFADSTAGLQLVECDPALGAPAKWGFQELAPAPGYVGALAWRRDAGVGQAVTGEPGPRA